MAKEKFDRSKPHVNIGTIGHVEGQISRGGTQIITAMVPLSTMFGYATDLRSRTQGRATYTMHFEKYMEAPRNVSEEVVARVMGKVGKE